MISASGGLITRGLGRPATQGLITMHFTTFIPLHEAPTTTTSCSGGGHVPVPLSRAVQSYTSNRATRGYSVPLHTTNTATHYTPQSKPGAPARLITVKSTFGDVTTTKEYLAAKHIDVKVTVKGFFTQLRESIKLIIEGLFK